MKNPFITRQKKNKGFTLVETLVAISIFTLSILAMMTVLSNGISNTGYAKKKIVASYLGQEGIEYMRNMRDTYMLFSPTADQGWAAFFAKTTGGSCGSANGCYYDDQNLNYVSNNLPITASPVASCSAKNSAAVCPNHPLLYNAATGKYGYGFGTNSGYSRMIRAVQLNPNEIQITSTVSWTQGTRLFTTTFSENIMNWIE